MLVKFSNQVLSGGPSAVLPQNLSRHWLSVLQQLADDFLDANFVEDECTDPIETGDPLLVACVHELMGNTTLNREELAEKVAVYALSVTMETINRTSDIDLTPPTLDNILSVDRLAAYKDKNPEFVTLLKGVCIISEKEKSWLQSTKNKLFSKILK